MEKSRVIRSAGVVGFWTAVSRLLGLVRDILMAGLFGTSVWMSAFVVAFTIPNLFRRLFGEGALSASFIPIFIEARRRDGEKSAWSLAGRVFILLAVVLGLLVLIGWATAAIALRFCEPGGKAALTLRMLQIMLPYAIFICLAALAMAVLNSCGHFAVPAAAPCVLNIVWITALIAVVPRLGGGQAAAVRVVAWAVVLAGILQVGMQLPALWRRGFRLTGIGNVFRRDERLVRMLRLMIPAALGLAVTQFNVVVDRLLALAVGPWAPAALFFSERMIYLPLGIFATALGTVLLPTYSGHAAGGDLEELKSSLNHGLRQVFFFMIPAATGLLIMAHPIVEMIYQWRNFTAQSTDLTAVALACYAPGLVVFSANKVLVPAFYARQDMRTPVRIGVVTVGLNILLDVLFVCTWPLYYKHAGLAAATVIAESFYALMLGVRLQACIGSPGWRRVLLSGLRQVVAAFFMAVCVFLFQKALGTLLPHTGGKAAAAAGVLASVAVGILSYAAAAAVLRCPELREIFSALVRARR